MKVLITVLADVRKNPRPNRLIRYLSREHDVSTLCYSRNMEGISKAFQIDAMGNTRLSKLWGALLIKIGLWRLQYWSNPSWRRARDDLSEQNYDVIFCHDLALMPLVEQIRNSAKVLLDLREYYPEQFANNRLWRFLFKRYNQMLCREYIHRSDKIFTVSSGIAQAYKSHFNVDVDLWMSFPDKFDIAPSATDGTKIKIIHHGGCLRSRKIEQMIEMMDHVDERFHLDLMLTNQGSSYYKKITAMAHNRPNVCVIEPVLFDQIIPRLSHYDIGLYICPPDNFNQKHALPNKFFEFIQARLCVIIAPSVEMKRILDEYQVGETSQDYTPRSLANVLNSLTTQKIDAYKKNSDTAADSLNVEANNQMIGREINRLCNTRSHDAR